MIVIDASALVLALIDDGPRGEAARAALSSDRHWAAPSHLPIETMSVVRGYLLGRKITAPRAEEAVAAVGDVVYDEVTIGELLPRMWELRANATPYDAAYIAAAERLGVALVTADVRMSKVPGLHCAVRVLGP